MLRPSLGIKFQRITLVNADTRSRITLDLNLRFKANGKECVAEQLAIAEIKQYRYNPKSMFMRVMKEMGIQPRKFSKYCMGLLYVNSGLKHNRFKSNLIQINKLAVIPVQNI